MRLLKTEGSNDPNWEPRLCDYRGERYAILSHRWAENNRDEVLFEDIQFIDDGGVDPSTGWLKRNVVYNSRYSQCPPRDKPGFNKLWMAARWAHSNGNDYLWADTCCIDSSNTAEVSEAINSLWKWYSASRGCYAYLHDVPNDLCNSRQYSEDTLKHADWWRRGFTLQELIAPQEVVFLNREWQLISYKSTPRMAHIIAAITRVEIDVLSHKKDLQQISIARRMSWAGLRKTSRVEDIAYCLMGIFQVNLTINYGEGDRAFQRLQEEIIKTSDDESIFAWLYEAAQSDQTSGLLARHPSAFRASYNYEPLRSDGVDQEPYTMTNRGLAIHLDPRPHASGFFIAALRCPAPDFENCFLAVYLQKVPNENNQYLRVRCERLTAVNKRTPGRKVYIKQHGLTGNLAAIDHTMAQVARMSIQPSPAVQALLVREQASDVRSISGISQLDAQDTNLAYRSSTALDRSTGPDSESRSRPSIAITDIASREASSRKSFWRRTTGA